MTQTIRIKINRQTCSGCLSCMTTCSMVNEAYASLSAARVRVQLNPFDSAHAIILCRQCTKAACVDACAERAVTRDADGCLIVNYDRCTGCQLCIEACPFDAMFWNPISGTVIKCELCRGDPECVQACPTGALTIQIVSSKRSRKTSE